MGDKEGFENLRASSSESTFEIDVAEAAEIKHGRVAMMAALGAAKLGMFDGAGDWL